MSKDNNQMDAMTNPYAMYGFGQQQQGFNPYAGYMDPSQFGYGYPMAQQPAQSLQVPPMPTQQVPGASAGAQMPGMLPIEESYIENILRLNKGKVATVYMTFEGAQQKVFKGVVEAAGRDHIILSDPQTGRRYILLMVYLDYITFDEEIEYQYPFGGGMGLVSYPPR